MDSFLKDYLFANQFWVIYFGALVGHFFSLNKIDFKGTLPFFKRLIPDKKELQKFYNAGHLPAISRNHAFVSGKLFRKFYLADNFNRVDLFSSY